MLLVHSKAMDSSGTDDCFGTEECSLEECSLEECSLEEIDVCRIGVLCDGRD